MSEMNDSVISSPGKSNKFGKGPLIPIGPEEQTFRRLLPRYLPRGSNHIYVSLCTDFKGQFLRGKSILSSENEFVVVHGLGGGMERAINLAHEIKNAIPTSSMGTSTSVFHVNEELGYLLEGDQQTRTVAVIHIKISKPLKQPDDDKGTPEDKRPVKKSHSQRLETL